MNVLMDILSKIMCALIVMMLKIACQIVAATKVVLSAKLDSILKMVVVTVVH